MTNTHERLACPECGNLLILNSFKKHRETQHGVVYERKRNAQGPRKPKARKPRAPRPVPLRTAARVHDPRKPLVRRIREAATSATRYRLRVLFIKMSWERLQGQKRP